MSFSPQSLLEVVRSLPTPGRYWVGYSGGRDSSVLLHALASIEEQLPAPLAAIHVDHGLHPDSAHWAAHCRTVCRALGVPMEEQRLGLVRQPGDSMEQVARDARYHAIGERMEPGEMLLTAHHGDDQVETFLLQLLRGAGVSGLAAMPLLREWANGWLARPLLGYSRADLEGWAAEQGLGWQEDTANADLTIPRNYLRHEIIPRLKRRWPALVATTSRSASHCADAKELIEEVAWDDLAAAGLTSPWQLSLDSLSSLSAARQRNLLRFWIRSQEVAVPGHQIIERILREVLHASGQSEPLVQWNGGEIRRYRNRLYLLPGLPPVPTQTLSWDGEKPLELPHGLGVLRFEQPAAQIQPPLEVTFRREGLKCRPAGREGSRSFKRLCQDLAIPPWLRPLLPLLRYKGALVAVADYTLCAPWDKRVRLLWERAPWLA